jgi:multiple sugar transport system substrate-binding protein
MKRLATAFVLLVALVLGVAVGAGSANRTLSTPLANSGSAATTITVWLPFGGRELGVMKAAIGEWDRKNANVNVKVAGNISTTNIVAAIRAGRAPDIAMDFESANIGTYCSTGAWTDLGPYISKDKVDVSIFPAAARYYTQYKGKRCAMPLLADVTGLYYNKTMFKAAGLSGPPKTISQLTAYAKKLTKRDKNGNLKVVGFDPFVGWYTNSNDRFIGMFGGKWVDSSGKSILSKDPAWAKMLRWQKSLVDWYGHDKLVKFHAGEGDEYSASNGFETGKLAMNLDGEWRVAFIAAEKPKLNYGTAPLPVDDARPDLYGSSALNGSIAGIPKNAPHKDQAWALLKYLTTQDHPLAQLSNGLRNVPTTKTSLRSPEIKPDKRFSVFLKIYAHPKSGTVPITAAGVAYQDLFTAFVTKWQAGHAKDLTGGLKTVDKQIDAQLKQAGGGVP